MPDTVSAVATDELVTTFDIHKPEIRNKLFRQYGNQGVLYYDVVKSLGYASAVAQTEFSHYAEGWIHQNVEVRNNVADPGAGNSIDFTLAATDLDSNNNFFIQEDDTVMFTNEVTGTVTNIDVTTPSAPVITVEPDGASDNIGALTAGELVIVTSNNFAEDTDQPESTVSKPEKRTFSTKIIKQTRTASGSELTNQNWYDQDTDGNRLPGIFYKQSMEADYEMKLRMDGALCFDRPTTNTTLIAAGKRTMTGVIPWMRTNGLSNSHGGTFAITDFDTMEEQLDSYNAPDESYGFLGTKFHQLIENTISTDNRFTAGGILYANFSEGKESSDINLNFSAFQKTGRNYVFSRMGSFNQRKLYGSTGYNINQMGYFAPTKQTKDARTREKMPYMSLRYKKMGNYSREMETWYTGGAGNIRKTDGRDRISINYRTECGGEPAAPKHWFLQEF